LLGLLAQSLGWILGQCHADQQQCGAHSEHSFPSRIHNTLLLKHEKDRLPLRFKTSFADCRELEPAFRMLDAVGRLDSDRHKLKLEHQREQAKA
jgi:hypothetical protein